MDPGQANGYDVNKCAKIAIKAIARGKHEKVIGGFDTIMTVPEEGLDRETPLPMLQDLITPLLLDSITLPPILSAWPPIMVQFSMVSATWSPA